MNYKKDLYLEARAEEAWFCSEQGQISFYNRQGKLSKSALIPDFPEQVDI
jgi:hypothetical protein